MIYSLAKYYLTISIPDSIAASFGASTITIGGEGSYMNSISINIDKTQWTIQGDVTGGHIYSKSLDRTGSCTVSLKQLSENVSKFITLCNIIYEADIEDTLTLVVTASDGAKVATLHSCMIEGIPQQVFGSEAADQDWKFLVGRVNIH